MTERGTGTIKNCDRAYHGEEDRQKERRPDKQLSQAEREREREGAGCLIEVIMTVL